MGQKGRYSVANEVETTDSQSQSSLWSANESFYAAKESTLKTASDLCCGGSELIQWLVQRQSKMLLSSAARHRRRRALSDSDTRGKNANPTDYRNVNQKMVQWRNSVKANENRKPRSQSAISYDQVLCKLSRVTDVLERSQSLDEDFQKDLGEIQRKMKEVNLKPEQDSKASQ